MGLENNKPHKLMFQKASLLACSVSIKNKDK